MNSDAHCSCSELIVALHSLHAKMSRRWFARRYDGVSENNATKMFASACTFDSSGWQLVVRGAYSRFLVEILAIVETLSAAASAEVFHRDARVKLPRRKTVIFPHFGWSSASDARVPMLTVFLRSSSMVPPRSDEVSQRLRVWVGNTKLLDMVANTNRLPALVEERAYLAAMADTCDLEMGQYPLTLAISKGWNHVFCGAKQASYIRWLLKIVNVNQSEWRLGMTPMHIACARGDPPELIQRLLDAGAATSLTTRDNTGRTPIDYINSATFEDAQKLLVRLACYSDSVAFGTSAHERVNVLSADDEQYDVRTNPTFLENECIVGTLPTREARMRNQTRVRELLLGLTVV